METQELLAHLTRALQLEGRSLVAYLSNEADLVLDQSSADARALYEEVRESSRSHFDRLSQAVLAERGVVEPGNYSFSFMRYNYNTVDSLLNDLADGLDALARGLDEIAGRFAGISTGYESMLRQFAATRSSQWERARALATSVDA